MRARSLRMASLSLEKLCFLRIPRRDENHRVAARRDHAPCKANHAIVVAANTYCVAQLKTGLHRRLPRNGCVMPAGNQAAGLAGLPRFEANHHGPNIRIVEANLHRQIGDIGRAGKPQQSE